MKGGETKEIPNTTLVPIHSRVRWFNSWIPIRILGIITIIIPFSVQQIPFFLILLDIKKKTKKY